MTKATVKVDKRSKAYRDSLKKLPQLKNLTKAATSLQDFMIKDMGKVVLQKKTSGWKKVPPIEALGDLKEYESVGEFVEKRSHLTMIQELQDVSQKQSDLISDLLIRMSNLETKVG